MKRRNFLQLLGLSPTLPLVLGAEVKTSPTRTSGPFKVGDVVKYVSVANTGSLYEYRKKENAKFFGNLGVIVKVNDRCNYNGHPTTYAVDAIKGKLPKHAWYEESEFELVRAIEDGIQ